MATDPRSGAGSTPAEVASASLLLRGLHERDGEQPALQVGERALSYGELRGAVGAVAAQIAGRERVGVWAEPTLETCVAIAGALAAGVPAVPINPKLGESELRHVLADSAPDVLFGGSGDMVDLDARAELPPDDHDPEGAGLIVYTSGTTGPPKGAILSRRALARNLDALADAWQWTPADLLVHALPLFHVHGLVLGVLGPLRLGGCAAPSRPLRAGRAHRCARGRGDARVRRADDVPPAGRRGGRTAAGRRRARAGAAAGFGLGAAAGAGLRAHRATHRAAHRRALRADRDADRHRRARRRRASRRLCRAATARRSSCGSSPTTAATSRRATTRRSARSWCAGRISSVAISTAWTTPQRRCATAGFTPATSPCARRTATCAIVGRRSTDLIKTGGYKVGAGEVETALLGTPGRRRGGGRRAARRRPRRAHRRLRRRGASRSSADELERARRRAS